MQNYIDRSGSSSMRTYLLPLAYTISCIILASFIISGRFLNNITIIYVIDSLLICIIIFTLEGQPLFLRMYFRKECFGM